MTQLQITKHQNKFIQDIIETQIPVRELISENKDVSVNMFFRWLREDESYAKQYAQAQEVRAEAMFDEMLKIADTPVKGTTIKTTKFGDEVTVADMIAHRRLQVDTRKWYLSKINPKKFSEKVQQELSITKEQPLFGDD